MERVASSPKTVSAMDIGQPSPGVGNRSMQSGFRNVLRFVIALSAIVLNVSGAAAAVIPQGVVDTTTQGNWVGKYGDQGYILSSYGSSYADVYSLPGYVGSYSISVYGNRYVWDTATSDQRALQNPSDPGGLRRAACWYGNQVITINPTATSHFQLGLYFVSWDSPDRALDVTLSGGGLTGTDSVTDYSGGKWYLYDVLATAGLPISISLASTGGGNAVISGVMFSTPSSDAVPEIDPAGMSAVMALVTGVLCLLERRRLQTA